MSALLSRSRREIITKESVYKYFGISRQGATKAVMKVEQENKMMREVEILVKNYRKDKDRRAGSRSLYHNIGIREKFDIGITKFEQLMAAHDLTLRQLRVKIVTTESCLQSWNYENLLNGLILNGINQVVVGDITYVSMGKDRYYLFNLIDIYSARWVGAWIGKRMRAIEAAKAFEQWLKLRGKKQLEGCIHHTDGGGQYFSNLYLGLLEDAKIKVSVARSCLENGYAEQRNGLIKNHLLPVVKVSDEKTLQKELKKMMYFYNFERKQNNLGWRTPVEFEEYTQSLDLGKRPEFKLIDFTKMNQNDSKK